MIQWLKAWIAHFNPQDSHGERRKFSELVLWHVFVLRGRTLAYQGPGFSL